MTPQLLTAAQRYCGCAGDGAVEAMLQCQRVSDFLIAASYLSIPLELLYFASSRRADLVATAAPLDLRWLLLQLAAFAALGGATHLLAVFASHHPQSARILLASTAAKLLAALVSFATAATSRAVRMLAHVRGRDPQAILHAAMLHLADTLALRSCAVWMPGHDAGGILHMVHQLSLRGKGPVGVVLGSQAPISEDDPDVFDIKSSEAAKVLRPGSALATASSGGLMPPGAVAAIRMPMLKVSSFDGGKTPDQASSYAILVLVLHSQDGSREWGTQDLDIVQVVSDQVAVALSHATVLEEWQVMRDKLAEQRRALSRAKHEAVVANNAIKYVQSAMCDGMRRPMHSIIGVLSMVRQAENMRREQKPVVDAIARTSTLSLALMNDVDMETLVMNCAPFRLHSLIREAMSVAGCLASCRAVSFSYKLVNSLPEWVVGDETRVFQLLLHMVGDVLSRQCKNGGRLLFSVKGCNVDEEDCIPMQLNLSAGCSTCVKFQVGMERSTGCSQLPHRPVSSHISMCKKIVQIMNGTVRSASDGQSITLTLQFQLQQLGVCRRTPPSIPRFNGLRILLIDSDSMSRVVTQKLLEKLGYQVMSASSSIHCLALLESADSSFQLLLLDLDMDVFEVALQIRELRNRRWFLIAAALPVSIVDSIREMCRRSGINGLIQKPITLTALGAQLSRVLQNF
ncbi:hypothetical protein BRADI_3g57807v3 [Brachypodium distachyon]|uniref:histidine kinase n=1 Tax=Brachypodium distachyon TaxID=15368 RepID=A0A2K2D5K8_BRADI|nr:hypothetical protein BRADI_3g57807v3 [Brachypodium distachyon]